MGVDVYMRWEGFGEEKKGNPNYDKQITGYQNNGKDGYLRMSYGYDKYEIVCQAWCWDWEKDTAFTPELIKEFIIKVNQLKGIEEDFIEEMLDFARLGKRLNKEDKNPKILTSY